ncbi:hypothetical protein E2562_002350 [Oryza meyeriana var. granulata]|uniref:Factor of DNA methylation 1-5/IDN2 domain-containing protein n=1 Tax=Oryza meyeriana var. granulata TaxID=110450 RepID=A0A6G1BJP0_9ORYZ|nr:hypothetical protein E2562_002350 [Oryza meyeriana var. granulata]
MAEPRSGSDDLGGRMNLILSKVESKIFFHKDAVVEYMDIKKLIGDLSEEKTRMEQEHHRRLVTASKELLDPVQEELDAANQELLHAKDQIMQVMEELVAAKQQLAQKCRELDQKICELEELKKKIQGTKTNNAEVHQQHHELVQSKGTKVMSSFAQQTPKKQMRTRSMCKGEKLLQANLGNGCLEHDLNAQWSARQQPMKDTTVGHCASRDDDLEIVREKLIKLPPEEANKVASELNSLWQELLNDKSWNPFHTIIVDGDCQVEVIDADDNKLQDLKMTWREGPYKSVTDALVERKEYNSDGLGIFDLWNYREGRKASLGECIEYIFDQVKQLKLVAP